MDTTLKGRQIRHRRVSAVSIEHTLAFGLSLGLTNPTINYMPDGVVSISWGSTAEVHDPNPWDR